MLLAYEAPKNVAGSEQLEDALKGLIVQAAIAGMRSGWDGDRCEVYARRLWDECLLGKKYSAGWPTVDAVRKVGASIAADMTKYDRPAPVGIEHRLPPPDRHGPLMGDEPDFMLDYPRYLRMVEYEAAPFCRPVLYQILATAKRRHEARYGVAS